MDRTLFSNGFGTNFGPLSAPAPFQRRILVRSKKEPVRNGKTYEEIEGVGVQQLFRFPGMGDDRFSSGKFQMTERKKVAVENAAFKREVRKYLRWLRVEGPRDGSPAAFNAIEGGPAENSAIAERTVGRSKLSGKTAGKERDDRRSYPTTGMEAIRR